MEKYPLTHTIKKYKISLVLLVVLLLGTGFAVYITQQKQDVRSKAQAINGYLDVQQYKNQNLQSVSCDTTNTCNLDNDGSPVIIIKVNKEYLENLVNQ